jgi:hypothetical protein
LAKLPTLVNWGAGVVVGAARGPGRVDGAARGVGRGASGGIEATRGAGNDAMRGA